MTRVTFGVSASSFAANMSIRHNAIQLALKYPQVVHVVKNSFYVDDGLTSADTIAEANALQQQLQAAFAKGGFHLRKWNSSDPKVLNQIPPELRDTKSTHGISDFDGFTKALGLEWNITDDYFHLTVAEWPSLESVTKRVFVSDIAKTFDVLGWFSPTIISMKILLQRLWELKLEWDEPVPQEVHDVWFRWRSELPSLATKTIPRCHFPKTAHITSIEIHGFSDASEDAYSGVVQLLAGLLHHVRTVFEVPISQVFAWTDSTIVLSWLSGNPRRFKTFVGNHVSSIIDSVPPPRWSHVIGAENPADYASRGVSPCELLNHPLWWEGPSWLHLASSHWPKQTPLSQTTVSTDEEREVCLLTTATTLSEPIISTSHYSSFIHLCRVTAMDSTFCSKLPCQ